MSNFAASELTLDKNGKVYHLGLAPGDVASTILLVGDPERVALTASYFDSVRFETRNREFVTMTGTYKGKDISVLSTGIGTDNIDIVLNELDAVFNIDLKTRQVKENKTSLRLIRIGTCGSLQETIAPGTHVISKYTIGLDGLAHFYQIPYSAEENQATESFLKEVNWSEKWNKPYFKTGDEALLNLLQEGMVPGITVTANGFYGPQGRAIRIPLSQSDFKDSIRKFNWQNTSVTNLEMETSGLYALSSALGHQAITVCLVLANRYTGEFEANYSQRMADLIQLVLHRLNS